MRSVVVVVVVVGVGVGEWEWECASVKWQNMDRRTDTRERKKLENHGQESHKRKQQIKR